MPSNLKGKNFVSKISWNNSAGLGISTSFFLLTNSSVSWRYHVIIMLNYEALIGHPYSVPTFTRNSLVDNFCCKYYTKILPSGWNGFFKFWMKGRARIQKFPYFSSQICNLSHPLSIWTGFFSQFETNWLFLPVSWLG